MNSVKNIEVKVGIDISLLEYPYCYTVQTVDLILPCIGGIPQLHSCIEKKILLNSLCWLGGKFMLSSSKQVGTGPWFESRT
jgi:hypothetical protein